MAQYRDETHAGLMARLQARLTLAERYRAETEALAAALRGDGAEAVSAALAAREALMGEIDTLTAALTPDLAAYRALGEGDPRAREAAEAVGRTREIFEAVQAMDREASAALRGLMGETAEEGRKLAKSREGIGKYAQKDTIFTPGVFDVQQ